MAYPPLCKPGHPQQQAEEHEQLKSPFKWPLQKRTPRRRDPRLLQLTWAWPVYCVGIMPPLLFRLSVRPWRALSVGLAVVLGMGGWSSAQAQVLLHVPLPNGGLMQAQALQLATDSLRLAQFGQTEEALRRLQLAVAMVPNSSELLYVLGNVHLELGDLEQAIASLQKARALSPQDGAVLYSLGSAYLRQGSYFAAAETLERAVALQPDNPNARFQLGNAYLMLDRWDAARQEYEKTLQLDPAYWPAMNNMGLVDYEQGDLDAAIDRWERTIEMNNAVAEPYLALATALYIRGETERAEELGAKAMRLDPNYARLQVLRENLWRENLLRDVQILLRTRPVAEALQQAAIEQFNRRMGLSE
ncbi:tetratricopeptide repeat protein [Synechococcus sp. JA-2-3B'a(2-13)]|nr:tetratricopeptide repeat protein [Synechococcus sp. JA-2-3B'a(2-13)]